jgi:hypothetical protein
MGPVIAGFVRHALTFVGSVLVTRGAMTPEDATTFADTLSIAVGALITAGSFLASWIAKRRKAATP